MQRAHSHGNRAPEATHHRTKEPRGGHQHQESEGAGATTLGKRGRYEDRRHGTHPLRGDKPHRRDQHRPTLPHRTSAGQPATRTQREAPKEDCHTRAQAEIAGHLRGARSPTPATAAKTRQHTSRTRSRPATTDPRTGGGGCTHTEDHRKHRTSHHRTLSARRQPWPPSTAGATTQTQGN